MLCREPEGRPEPVRLRIREGAIARKAGNAERVTENPAQDTRELVLTCAARLFRSLGYAAVSLRDVASEAGVTTGSLYHHFGSKDELVRALLEKGYRQILEDVEAALASARAGGNPRDALLAALTAHLTCLLGPDSLPAANVRIHAHVPQHLRNATLKGRRRYEQFWADLLRDYAHDGLVKQGIEPKSLVMILFGAMNWSLEWSRPGRDDPEAFAAELLSLIEARAS